MELLSYLIGVTLRTFVLAAIAWLAMAVFRVKSPASRHAVWTVVVAGMLSLSAIAALLPPLKIRVLQPRTSPPVALPIAATFTAPRSLPLPESHSFPWVAALYAAGLLAFSARLSYACLLTRRLIRESHAVPRFHGQEILQSERIHVPLTVGAKILLPPDWESWSADQLNAVLVHERNHVRRADWAIAVIASVNRCVFWFHPLAWWLERELATLAEHACDDASLAQVASRESYAETLLAMAAAVRTQEGRITWEATAMAKTTEVRTRVERILDENLPVWPGMTRARWFALAICGVPLICLTALVRPARVAAQIAPAPQIGFAVQEPVSSQLEERMAVESELRRRQLQLEAQMQTTATRLARNNVLRAEKAAAELQQQHRAGSTAQLQDQLAALQTELEKMSEQYTPNHPQIKRTQASIAILEARLQEMKLEARDQEPLLADMTASTQDLERDVERINAAVAETNQRIAKLNSAIPQTPQRLVVFAPPPGARSTSPFRLDSGALHLQGAVELLVTIGPEGKVQDVKVIRSLHPALDRMAIESVKRLHYFTVNGEKAPNVMHEVVTFR